MPLTQGSSPAIISRNISEMQAAGHPHDQAVAAALSTARKAKIAHRQMGGIASPPWFARNEARSLAGHTGPILSAVGGRTDHHAMHVPSGSYVLPADHVSSIGQGNTGNGMAILGRMFGTSPYGGGSPMGIKHGSGAPRPPRAFSDKGGARGDHIGQPTPIYAAGGEFVVPPESIIRRYGSLEAGHKILDKWVVSNRKKHIETLKKLPGPAKS